MFPMTLRISLVLSLCWILYISAVFCVDLNDISGEMCSLTRDRHAYSPDQLIALRTTLRPAPAVCHKIRSLLLCRARGCRGGRNLRRRRTYQYSLTYGEPGDVTPVLSESGSRNHAPFNVNKRSADYSSLIPVITSVTTRRHPCTTSRDYYRRRVPVLKRVYSADNLESTVAITQSFTTLGLQDVLSTGGASTTGDHQSPSYELPSNCQPIRTVNSTMLQALSVASQSSTAIAPSLSAPARHSSPSLVGSR